MTHHISDLDSCLLSAFDAATLDIKAFHHREHVRLAYILLALNAVPSAHNKMRNGLLRLLEQNGLARAQFFHETLTLAWMQAIQHFMYLSPNTDSSEDFIAQNPVALDKEIMFTHYSRALIEQAVARSQFVAPDLQLIPEHAVLSK